MPQWCGRHCQGEMAATGIREDGFHGSKISWQELVIPAESDQSIIWVMNNKRQEHICLAANSVPLHMATSSEDFQGKDETLQWFAFLLICNLIYHSRLKCSYVESPCEAFLCWFAFLSAQLPPLIRERKCLRCFRVRTYLGDKKVEPQRGRARQVYLHHKSTQKRPWDSVVHPDWSLERKKT